MKETKALFLYFGALLRLFRVITKLISIKNLSHDLKIKGIDE